MEAVEMNRQTVTPRRILLVDDDALILDFLKQILQHAGYETYVANTGEEALRIAQEAEPDLALLDVHMPDMSGLELAKYFQEKTAIPFMFLSSSADSEIVGRATEHGAIGYLVKPIEATKILPVFQTALARADEIKRLKRTEINLTQALNAGRETSIAIGMLMERYKLDRDGAFEALRDYARSNRRKLNDVAKELLLAAETLNQFQTSTALQSRA
jgi:AmiR/NasT family two-component response regulator